MSKKLSYVFVFILFALATHAYLTTHYYPLKFGMSHGQTLCNVNAYLDCDVAAVSPYSNIAGVPLSVFGLSFHLVLLALMLMAWLGLSESPKRIVRYCFYLALSSVGASLILAVISFAELTAICPFCVAAYIWSLCIAFGFYLATETPFGLIAEDIKALFSEQKGVLIALLVIPAGSWLIHKSVIQKYGAGQLDVVINSSLADWLASPKNTFPVEPALSSLPGEKSTSIELVEFADFRCGHCGQAAPSLRAFKKAHPEVDFKFYNFPLDGICNESVPREGDGVSCRLAKAVTCASEQNSRVGWKLHDYLFENQSLFQRLRSQSDVDAEINKAPISASIDQEKLVSCMDSEKTLEHVKLQAKMGADAEIRGTPTIFLNGRRLPRGQLLPVLNAAFERASKQAKTQ